MMDGGAGAAHTLPGARRAAAAAVLSWLEGAGVHLLTAEEPGTWFRRPNVGPASISPAAEQEWREPPAAAASRETPPIADPLAERAPSTAAVPAAANGADRPPVTTLALTRTSGAAEIVARCETLEDLQAALADYDGCALKSGGTCTVFADGDPASRIMVVGEAPGAEEDRMGRPFVGAAGRLLDRMMAAIGRDRSSLYISNIIYWRPPANRKPSDADISACMPFVRRQIELVAPRAILALGNTAAKSLLDRPEGINRLRGRWYDYAADGRTIPLMPTFHPAYLLRQPAHKALAWCDLMAFAKRISADA
jgi:uracil-DNA glycosylase family 4